MQIIWAQLLLSNSKEQVSNTAQACQTSHSEATCPCIKAFFKRNLFCSQPHCAMAILKEPFKLKNYETKPS